MRAVRGAKIALIFQEPMTALNPVMRVGDQIAEALIVHGQATHTEARARAIALLEAVRVPDPAARVRDYPHQLSGGMRQRVLIAMALACKPSLVIADEPTTALDVTIQAQVLDLLREMKATLNLSLLLITHDLAVIAGTADRVAVMYAGRVVEEGPVRAILLRARSIINTPRPAGLDTWRRAGHATSRDRRHRADARRASFWLRLQSPLCPDRFEPCTTDAAAGALRRRPGSQRAQRCYLHRPWDADAARRGVPPRQAFHAGQGATTSGPSSHRRCKAVDDVSFLLEEERDVRSGRRIGKRQDDHRPLHPAADRSDLRLRSASAAKTSSPRPFVAKTHAAAAARYMQIVFQDPYSSLNPRMRVYLARSHRGAAGHPPGSATAPRGAQRVAELFELVGLEPRAPRTLPARIPSGGQRQRIRDPARPGAESVVPGPRCREPVSALDVSVQAQVDQSADGPAGAG